MTRQNGSFNELATYKSLILFLALSIEHPGHLVQASDSAAQNAPDPREDFCDGRQLHWVQPVDLASRFANLNN